MSHSYVGKFPNEPPTSFVTGGPLETYHIKPCDVFNCHELMKANELFVGVPWASSKTIATNIGLVSHMLRGVQLQHYRAPLLTDGWHRIIDWSFSPFDPRKFATVCNGELQFYSVQEEARSAHLILKPDHVTKSAVPESDIIQFQYNSAMDLLLTCDSSESVKIFDVGYSCFVSGTGANKLSVAEQGPRKAGHRNKVPTLLRAVWGADHSTIYASYGNGVVLKLDARSENLVVGSQAYHQKNFLSKPVYVYPLSHEHHILTAGSFHGKLELKMWDERNTQNVIQTLDLGSTSSPPIIIIDDESRHAFAAAKGDVTMRHLSLFNPDTRTPELRLEASYYGKSPIRQLTMIPRTSWQHHKNEIGQLLKSDAATVETLHVYAKAAASLYRIPVNPSNSNATTSTPSTPSNGGATSPIQASATSAPVSPEIEATPPPSPATVSDDPTLTIQTSTSDSTSSTGGSNLNKSLKGSQNGRLALSLSTSNNSTATAAAPASVITQQQTSDYNEQGTFTFSFGLGSSRRYNSISQSPSTSPRGEPDATSTNQPKNSAVWRTASQEIDLCVTCGRPTNSTAAPPANPVSKTLSEIPQPDYFSGCPEMLERKIVMSTNEWLEKKATPQLHTIPITPWGQLTSDISKEFLSRTVSDCEITLESGENYPAHKCILSVRSPYFKQLFESSSSAKSFIISNTGFSITGSVFERVLFYIYTDTLPEPYMKDHSQEVWNLASLLGLFQLRRWIDCYLKNSDDQKYHSFYAHQLKLLMNKPTDYYADTKLIPGIGANAMEAGESFVENRCVYCRSQPPTPIMAHSLILASRNTFIYRAVTSGMKESQNHEFAFEMISEPTLKVFNHFMYTNTIECDDSNHLMELWIAGDAYFMPNLVSACELALREMVDVDNCIPLYQRAGTSVTYLRTFLANYIASRYAVINDEMKQYLDSTFKEDLEQNFMPVKSSVVITAK